MHYITTTFCCLTGIIFPELPQAGLGSPNENTLGQLLQVALLLQARCWSSHPTNSVETLKKLNEQEQHEMITE